MCSVFGFIRKRGAESTDLRAPILKIITANIARGPHAFGFAWIDTAGRLKSYRSMGNLLKHTELIERAAAEATMLIGHLRFATHGSQHHAINNHPHPSDGGWIVHNGIVNNHQELNERFDLTPTSECDTETLGLLIERQDGTLLQRCAETVNLVDDGSPLAMLGLWSRPGTMIVTRRGNPLHTCEAANVIYLASMPAGALFRPVIDETLMRFTASGRIEERCTLDPRQGIAWRSCGLAGQGVID